MTSPPLEGEYREVEEPTRALQLAPSPTDLPINVDKLVARREQFHEFMKRVLKNGTHYGIPLDKDGQPIRGIAKPFLYQSGAEDVFSAFECRPRYSSTMQQVDKATGTVILIQRCEAVHMSTGFVMGEGLGSATDEEFMVNCKYSTYDFVEGNLINCPEHGRGKAKVWN